MSEELESCPVCGALPCDQVELVSNSYKLPSPTPEGRGGETLTTLLRRAKQTLCVPAAEYVPAMGDAMLLLDKAIQMSYQTDPNWLLSSPRVEDVRREALEEAAAVADEYARLPPLFNHGTQPSRAEKAVMEAAAIIAQDIRALSPPVG